MRIDHVIWGTSDLDATADRLALEHGLRATGGGRHDGLGTHNRIVPLGDGYLEILAIADPSEAAGSALGRAVTERLAIMGEGLLGWALQVDHVGPVAARLGTEISTITRQGLSARLTGVAESMAEPCLPFFLERDPRNDDPGVGGNARGLTWVEVAGDRARIEAWLGGADLPVRVREGEPALLGVGIGDRELR